MRSNTYQRRAKKKIEELAKYTKIMKNMASIDFNEEVVAGKIYKIVDPCRMDDNYINVNNGVKVSRYKFKEIPDEGWLCLGREGRNWLLVGDFSRQVKIYKPTKANPVPTLSQLFLFFS